MRDKSLRRDEEGMGSCRFRSVNLLGEKAPPRRCNVSSRGNHGSMSYMYAELLFQMGIVAYNARTLSIFHASLSLSSSFCVSPPVFDETPADERNDRRPSWILSTRKLLSPPKTCLRRGNGTSGAFSDDAGPLRWNAKSRTKHASAGVDATNAAKERSKPLGV